MEHENRQQNAQAADRSGDPPGNRENGQAAGQASGQNQAQKNVRPVPEGMRSVTPHLVVDGAVSAIDFYRNAFGAQEEGRLAGPEGKLMHAQLRIGDSAVMLVDEFPQWGSVGPKSLGGSPVTIHLYVEDADATFARATAAGATVKMPVQDMFWGDRYGLVTDPFGHHWSIATHVRDVSPEEMRQAMAQMPHSPDAAGQPRN
jgi:PhnB protein